MDESANAARIFVKETKKDRCTADLPNLINNCIAKKTKTEVYLMKHRLMNFHI